MLTKRIEHQGIYCEVCGEGKPVETNHILYGLNTCHECWVESGAEEDMMEQEYNRNDKTIKKILNNKVKEVTIRKEYFIKNGLGESEFNWILSQLDIPEENYKHIEEITLRMEIRGVETDRY